MTLTNAWCGSTMVSIRYVKFLDDQRDNEILPRLIPLVDELTHILLDESKNRLQ
jgi:hypothetical protein